MKICLNTYSRQAAPSHVNIHLTERLPAHIVSDCDVSCDYFVQSMRGYYLLTLKIKASVSIICQRCLEQFLYDFSNTTEIAVCRNDEAAEQMLSTYESMVSEDAEINLIDLVTDELHLCVPEKHEHLGDCRKD